MHRPSRHGTTAADREKTVRELSRTLPGGVHFGEFSEMLRHEGGESPREYGGGPGALVGAPFCPSSGSGARLSAAPMPVLRQEVPMTGFNAVRFKVKDGRDQEFLDAHSKVDRSWPGMRHANIIKTGEHTYCIIAEGDDRESLAKKRPHSGGRLEDYVLEKVGAQGRSRTTDTAIFSRMLYQLSYLGPAPANRSDGRGYRGWCVDCPHLSTAIFFRLPRRMSRPRSGYCLF